MEAGQKIDKYRLISPIGIGGMGEVWKAQDEGITGREVAIKVVRSGATAGYLEALAGEARTLAKTPHHPNMVILYDVIEANDELALVMEFIPGATLSALIKAHPQGLPWGWAHTVFHGLFDGVGHAHRNHVIHRDLKPDNVLINHYEGGRPFEANDIKILDFGLARIEKEFGTQFTRSAAGTLTYMSPEQLREEPQGPFTDVYALGVMLYEALLGQPPFGGAEQTSFSALVRAHCDLPPPPPGARRLGMAGPLEAAILRALSKEPERRFASAVEMGQAVLPLLQQHMISTPVAPSRYQQTVDLSEVTSGTVRNSSLVGSVPLAGPDRATALLPPVPPQPASGARAASVKGPLKWAGAALVGALLIASGVALSRTRSTAPAVILKPTPPMAVPGLCEVKGYAYQSTDPQSGKSTPRALPTFFLGTTHVSVDQFRAFVKATGHEAGAEWDRSGKGSHPVTSVSYHDAQAYVAWLSKATGEAWYLPSGEEYEFAASNRGESILYPWGSSATPGQANMGHSGTLEDPVPTVPVGSFPANGLGLRDLIGNAWMWTSTTLEGGQQRLKGGSWNEDYGSIKISHSIKRPADLRDSRIGFRVARR